MRRAAKVDGNQQEIVKALRQAGATVLITSQLKNAFDILVGFRGKLFIIEIKDGKLPPSQRRLTEGESACKFNFNRVGITYHIVTSADEALFLIFD